MNILIVGNGFDLSHYLPTKYDHFMLVMQAIEGKDLTKPACDAYYYPSDTFINGIVKAYMIYRAFDNQSYQMTFDALFSKFTKTQDKKLIVDIKQHYELSKVLLKSNDIADIQSKLKKNSWYEYFKNHIKEIDTWIDFELKIGEVLNIIALFALKLETIISEQGLSSKEISFSEKLSVGQIFLTREYCNILELLKIIKSGYYAYREFEDEYYGTYSQEVEVEYNQEENQNFKFYIENDYSLYQNGSYKVRIDKIISSLHKQLEEFIELFNIYLELVINKLEPKSQFKIEAESWVKPDHIFSFNYTNTFQKFYTSTNTGFLHGRFGEKQNIVLGISDLEDASLKKLKAYGFTKYHQKLFKETDYLFLDKFKKKVEKHKRRIEYFEKDFGYEDSTARKFERQKIMEAESPLDLNIKIWGHSLDSSDRDYILDLFSLNDDIDRKVRVVVYYYDDNAKFMLLNNLLAILGKDKVEKWMKNKWLTFEKNPEVKFAENISEQTV